MKKMVLGAAMLAVAAVAQPGQAASISFDTAQADYTPLPQSTLQQLYNQFASLGILFRDPTDYSRGATLGDCTGGVGSDPVHLYGYGTSGNCGDTTPNIDMLFVDPTNMAIVSFTTSFSILVTDGSGTVMTAYDAGGSVLGSTSTTSGYNERITLTGIGNIARINIQTLTDATAYDDLIFDDVAVTAVPEPASWAMMIGGLGLAGAAMRRRKATLRFA